MGGLGPMLGQNHHFNRYAPEKIPYAIERYVNETRRLYGVLDRRLDGRAFVAGKDYSIADMAAYPWIVSYENQGMTLEEFPNVKIWFETIRDRPATQRAYKLGEALQKPDQPMSEDAKKILFGQR
jgi:GSH-dependent disulfide-bond oxidoreductase